MKLRSCAARLHSRARLGVEQGAGVSRVRRGASQGRRRDSRADRSGFSGHVASPDPRTGPASARAETVRTSTMDYEAYTPDSTSRIKSGYAYRVLGHDAATYYQYAIYVRVSPASSTIPTRARRPSSVTERGQARERRARTDEAKDVGAIAPSRRARSRASARARPRRVADVHGRTGIAIESPARLARPAARRGRAFHRPTRRGCVADVYAAATFEPPVGAAGRDALDRGGFTGRPVLTRSRCFFLDFSKFRAHTF